MSEPSVISEGKSGKLSASASKSAPSPSGSPTSPRLTGAALWAAIFAIAVWIGFSIFLILKAGTNETEWTRIAWVFGSIQGVAFAAAGALFGTAVQQQNVNNAQQQAASAKNDADQQREAAIKGRALATVMQVEVAAQPTGGAESARRVGIGDATGAGSPDEMRQRYAQLSRALFGDLI